jgi:hypothetical protein
MANALETWKVHPHKPIEKLTENLWRVEGRVPGAPIDRTMLIARRATGELVIHNAIALDDTEMKEIENWGTPAVLIVPNGGHRLDAAIFKQRYPSLRVVGPEAGRTKIEQVVKVDATSLSDGDDTVRYEPLQGCREGVMIVRSKDGTTLVFTDILMNMKSISGFGGFLMGVVGFTSPAPRVTFPSRRLVMTEKAALKAELEKRAATPGLSRIEVGHGAPVTSAAPEALRGAAAAI